MTATLPVVDRTARRAAVAGGVGSVVEWYDYGLYGIAAALYIRPLFFSGASELTGTLLSLATFAVGFVARPVGGIVLGWAGDRWGRRPVLLFTVLLMGIATTLMGVLPTAATAGVLAPVLLVALRLVQGFGAGAELAGAFVYVTESAPPRRQAFLASFSSAATSVGLLLSTAVFAVLEVVLPEGDMLAYGWRIPFLLSAVVVIAALVARSRIEESAAFRASSGVAAQDLAASDVTVSDLPGEVDRGGARSWAAGLLAPTAVGVGGYVTSVYAISYVTSAQDVSAGVALLGVLLLAAVSAVTCVGFGALSDRIGSARVFLGGTVFLAVFAFPFFALLQTGDPVLVVVALVVNYAIGWAACAGAQGKFLAGLFGTRRRFAGVATTRELNSAFLAGPAPFVAAALTGAVGGSPWPVAVMVIAAAVLTAIGAALGRHDGVPRPPS
ncbi:sugar transport protein [Pseudonocardia sediminis]|uniref:Sugar transport protein n=1 Tax=Pseudonocardia sediminis TaxID=1397368 RepID=A0A4Q7V4C2_PSEST|nr:MFS transporter [Pseudonocardia sediminis]RZT88935.1 sugar transport protein [Pseudonocardia sediminis]